MIKKWYGGIKINEIDKNEYKNRKKSLINWINDFLQWQNNRKKSGTKDKYDLHIENGLEIFNSLLPSGSGFDSGSSIDIDKSKPDNKIIIFTGFHHMTEYGYYNGWTEHQVNVYPSFNGFNLRITGPNRNEIKDYMHDIFDSALNELYSYNDIFGTDYNIESDN